MWKFFEDLKKDFEDVKDDIKDDERTSAQRKQAEQDSLDLGKTALTKDGIVSLENGTVEMINQDQDEVEIYFDNGHGLAIRFPMGPVGYKVLVSANQEVKKGQLLVAFGPELSAQAKVYAFTPDMLEVLSNSRFRIN